MLTKAKKFFPLTNGIMNNKLGALIFFWHKFSGNIMRILHSILIEFWRICLAIIGNNYNNKRVRGIPTIKQTNFKAHDSDHTTQLMFGFKFEK